MQCAESLRVQAYFDGEVDAVSAAEIERHADHCNECRALLEDLQKVRATLRREVSYAGAPPKLRAQILRALDQESTSSPGIVEGRPATSRTWRPVFLSYQVRFRLSVTLPSCTMRLPDRSGGLASPRFSRHRRTKAASSLPMMIRTSEPPTKERRLIEPTPLESAMTEPL